MAGIGYPRGGGGMAPPPLRPIWVSLKRNGRPLLTLSPGLAHRMLRRSLFVELPPGALTPSPREEEQSMSTSAWFFVGLDVSKCWIWALFLDPQGEELDRFRFPNDHGGYEHFLQRLRRLERQTEQQAMVASEGSHGHISPLDHYLTQEGICYHPLPPQRIRKHKEALGQPKSTDLYDAWVIADFLRCHHQRLSPPPEPSLQALRELTRAHQDFVQQRTALINKLKQKLSEYFPEYLKVFPQIQGKTSLALLSRFPTPQSLEELSQEELAAFVYRQSRGHFGGAKALALLQAARKITRRPAHLAALECIVPCLAQQIQRLTTAVKELREEIEEQVSGLEAAAIVQSFPGTGPILAARYLAETGGIEAFQSEGAHAVYVGVAPIPDQSGKRRRDRTTYQVNKRAKDALMQMAQKSARYDPNSQAYLAKKMAEGLGYWKAVKYLARQMARTLWAMLRDGQPYDPQQAAPNARKEVAMLT
ncbi:MAG: IS110 family transposase [Candidatus Bipolaricaulia bacterium]